MKHLKDYAKALLRVAIALLNYSINERPFNLFDDIVNLELLNKPPLQLVLALSSLDLIQQGVNDGSHQVYLFEHSLFIVLGLIDQNLPQVKGTQRLHFHSMKHLVFYNPQMFVVVGLGMVRDFKIL